MDTLTRWRPWTSATFQSERGTTRSCAVMVRLAAYDSSKLRQISSPSNVNWPSGLPLGVGRWIGTFGERTTRYEPCSRGDSDRCRVPHSVSSVGGGSSRRWQCRGHPRVPGLPGTGDADHRSVLSRFVRVPRLGNAEGSSLRVLKGSSRHLSGKVPAS